VRPGAPATVILCAVLLTGCGGSSTSSNHEASKRAAQILTDTRNAAQAAQTVHYVGTIAQSGQRIHIDLHLVAGRGGAGTLAIGMRTIQIVRIGKKAYFKGSAAFYRSVGAGAAAQLLQGRWLEAPAHSGPLASFTPLTDMSTFFNLTGARAVKKADVSKGAETTVDGQEVIPLRAAKSGTLYVAATGTPYPVEVTKPSGGWSGALHFDQWNAKVNLVAPKNTVDISKLTG